MEVSAENLIVTINSQNESSTMMKGNEKQSSGLAEMGVGLDEMIRRGARRDIEQAIETELPELLAQYGKTVQDNPSLQQDFAA